MREQITFFDFFESFVPPRELRLLFHDAVVTGGSLDRKQRALELDVATGERIPEAAQTALEQLLTRQYGLHRLHLTIHDRKAEKKSGGTEVSGPGQGDQGQARLHDGAERESRVRPSWRARSLPPSAGRPSAPVCGC